MKIQNLSFILQLFLRIYFSFFIISVAEKRTVCLQEVNELKETDSIQFLNEIDQIAPCKATLALTGKAKYDRLTIMQTFK